MWDLIVSVPAHCLSFYFGGKRLGWGMILGLPAPVMKRFLTRPIFRPGHLAPLFGKPRSIF